MKLKRRKVKRGRVEIIPMIDTIVILLIFYMTFSRFAEENKQAVNLPFSKAGDDFKVSPGQVIVNIFSKDDVRIGDNKLTAKELPDLLNRIRASDKAQFAKMSVILRGDKTMTYKDLSDVMVACAKAQIIDVTFATLEAR